MTESEPRLPAALWIEAHLRRLDGEGVPYYIVQKGAYAAGTVLLKIDGRENGCRLLIQQRDPDGVLGWTAALKEEILPEAKADDYIRRAAARDPDLWVIEVEDRKHRNPFDGGAF